MTKFIPEIHVPIAVGADAELEVPDFITSTTETLHAFPSDVTVGHTLRAGLVQASDGCLYGRTSFAPGIFRMSLDGSEFTTLHSFLDGSSPHFGLVEGLDQNLYGLVAGDPYADLGTIFSVGETSTGPYNVLFILPRFCRPYNGSLALGLDSALYGTTPTNGPSYPGTVFRFGLLQ